MLLFHKVIDNMNSTFYLSELRYQKHEIALWSLSSQTNCGAYQSRAFLVQLFRDHMLK